jgi:SAM-dependent methyltransferase
VPRVKLGVERSKRLAHMGLAAIGMHGAALRARDRMRARQALRRDPHVAGPDGLPLPPDELIAQVSGIRVAEEFIAGGAVGRDVITAVLAGNGVRVAELGAMLDFGVGCGRVARHWAGLDVDVQGCDYNPELVAWCRRNLPHVTARSNGLDPPLPYEDERFDLVYALSVFTHLTESRQRSWIAELRRVTRPGGLVLFTTHGPSFGFSDRAWPPPEIRARLADGELVVVLPEHAGRNACTAIHPRAWVEEHMLAGLELLEYRENGAAMNGGQDLYLARRSRS